MVENYTAKATQNCPPCYIRPGCKVTWKNKTQAPLFVFPHNRNHQHDVIGFALRSRENMKEMQWFWNLQEHSQLMWGRILQKCTSRFRCLLKYRQNIIVLIRFTSGIHISGWTVSKDDFFQKQISSLFRKSLMVLRFTTAVCGRRKWFTQNWFVTTYATI